MESVSLKLYPNPVLNKLTITTDLVLKKVEIYSISGQLLKQISDNTKEIDLSSVKSGHYLIKFVTSKGVISKMVIKK